MHFTARVPATQLHAPLFHPRPLADRIATTTFPEDLDARHGMVLQWIKALRVGKIDETKEVSLHGAFLERIFGDVLGYRGLTQAGGGGWELIAEKTVSSRGKSADGALGFFGGAGSPRVFAPIELKGAKQSLDHAKGRALTPVQQAWDYANHSPGCRWIIVSNYRETRLYSTLRTPGEYEVFFLEQLETLDAFKRFYAILARENLLPKGPEGASPIDDLLARSAEVETEITVELYKKYRKLRHDLYAHLCRVHPNLPQVEVLSHAQTILDRILFIAFAEDRDLLPRGTIKEAYKHRDRYRPAPIWENFKAVFRWIDTGNPNERIHAYNGGLFRYHPDIDGLLELSDEMCEEFKNLAAYDFREEVSVDVLGHIFEQSITDLEELRAEAEGRPLDPKKLSKRKTEGVFYTPPYITRFIVEHTLGRVMQERWEAALAQHEPEKQKGKKKQEQAWIATWESYRDALKETRVLDPACGSGAFLIAAFDALAREYERVNAALDQFRGGQRGLFDLTKTILNNNLFGVDLNRESVEITKLSLWLKTAEPGKPLTYLDSNIKCGNSIVSDPKLDPFAFDWKKGALKRSFFDKPEEPDAASIDARWREGFDSVIGNPPYVRQELLTPIKEHLKASYRSYHGMADLYVYFFERGLSVLKPGGRLGFVVSNKWLRSGYAEPLRGLLASETRMETLVDFGHAPIFADADTFPCVVTMARPVKETKLPVDHAVEVTSFPRDELKQVAVQEYVARHRHSVPQIRLGAKAWSLEPPKQEALFAKIREGRLPLAEYVGTKPNWGIKTGFNEAFLVDTPTAARLISRSPRTSEILKKFLRGQDVARWQVEWDGLWLILLQSSADFGWPWRGMEEHKAEKVFKEHLPAIHEHMKPMEHVLRKRSDKGRYWWELRSCAYYDLFIVPKIVYQEIQFHSAYAIDDDSIFLNNKCFFLPSGDLWLLAVLNSPLMWWHNWRYLSHMKDEALSPQNIKMESLPVAPPSDRLRSNVESIVPRLVASVKLDNETQSGVLDVLRTQFDIEKPGQKLEDFASLDADGFVKEVLARRPKKGSIVKPAALKALREIYDEEARGIQERRREAMELERKLSDLVNEAYGLSPEDIQLLWETAPPRMPVGR